MTQDDLQQVLEAISAQTQDISSVESVSNPQDIASVLSLPGQRTDTQQFVRIPYSALVTLAQTIATEVIRSFGYADKSYIRVNTPNGVKYLLFVNGIMAGASDNLPTDFSSANDLTNA